MTNMREAGMFSLKKGTVFDAEMIAKLRYINYQLFVKMH
jgi:hypothetical protein